MTNYRERHQVTYADPQPKTLDTESHRKTNQALQFHLMRFALAVTSCLRDSAHQDNDASERQMEMAQSQKTMQPSSPMRPMRRLPPQYRCKQNQSASHSPRISAPNRSRIAPMLGSSEAHASGLERISRLLNPSAPFRTFFPSINQWTLCSDVPGLISH